MGNKASQQTAQSSTNYRPTSNYTADNQENVPGTVRYSPTSSLLTTKARCSQAGCMKYQDEGNYLGFCIDCYKNYRRILFEDSGPPTLTVSGRTHHGSGTSSSSSRTTQASQRSSHSGIQVTTNGSSSYTSSYSYSSRTNGSGTTGTSGISQRRTTSSSSARTPVTTSTSARTPVTTSTRTTGNTYLWTTHDPLGNYTIVHGTGSSRTPGLASTRTTGISATRTTGTSSARTPGTTSTSARTPGTTSTRTTGSTYLQTTHDPLYYAAGLTSTTTGTASARGTVSSTYSGSTYDPYCSMYGGASTRASGASSTRTGGGAHGSTSGLTVGSGVGTGSSVLTNTHSSTGARPKQYQSFPSQTSRSQPNLRPLMDIDVRQTKDTEVAKEKISTKTPASDSATTKTSKTSSKKDSQGSVVKTMRDNLLCPICLDLLEDAKTLPCQHTVCKDCLVQWVASKGELRCPTCNTKQTSPAGGVEGLPSNFTLNSLVAEMKKLDNEEDAETGNFDEEDEDEDDEEPEPITTPSITTSFGSKPQTDFSSAYAGWQKIPVAETSFLEVLGKPFRVQGSTVKLKLQLCDVEGELMRRESKAGIEGTVILPNNEKTTVTDISHRKKSGDFTVSFPAEMMGVHHVVVTLEGEEVVGSPFRIVVRPNGKMSRSLGSFAFTAPKGVTALNSEDIYVTDENGFACTCIDSDDSVSFLDRPDHKDFCQISPFGIAKSNDKLYITDSSNSCVYVYIDGEYVNNFGKRVLEHPAGVVVGKDGTIYVADCGASSIDIFRANYSHVRSIDLKGRGSVVHLALNQAENRILLADDKTNVIKIIDVNNGRMVKQIKTRINQAPATPYGVAVDAEDNIFVSVTFDPAKVTKGKGAARTGDSIRRGAVITYNSNGYYLGTIGEKELINPRGICFVADPWNELFVVEAGDDDDESPCLKVFQL